MCDWCRLCCALCRIGCYKCCHKPPATRPEYTVVALGLNNAGKSTLLALLANEEIHDHPEPTKGFSIKALQFPEAIVNVKELGGDVEQYWAHYYGGSQGIIFIVDSSDNGHLNEAAQCLSKVLCNTTLSGLPLLILANKQDLSNAKDKDEVVEILKLNEVAQDYDWVIHACSSQDKNSVQEGFSKLIDKLIIDKPIEENRI
ncbi:ADP-ribosylation factor-like protein 15 [Dendronephthya gigantea]|uniref:ADP-ribosylation factor-like protein 15 n=1 Tax=Dendronephthya gigantea TaxID=151771 RepID=UPI00106BE5EA|nr:ADP-ribosylation factor-like protein 15 [Dendronephthya gigantea]